MSCYQRTVDSLIGHPGINARYHVDTERRQEIALAQTRLQATEGGTVQWSHKRLENATSFLVQVIGILFSDIRIVFRRILQFVWVTLAKLHDTNSMIIQFQFHVKYGKSQLPRSADDCVWKYTQVTTGDHGWPRKWPRMTTDDHGWPWVEHKNKHRGSMANSWIYTVDFCTYFRTIAY